MKTGYKQSKFYIIILILIPILVCMASAWLYSGNIADIIRIGVIMAACLLVLAFCWYNCVKYDELLFDNSINPVRFFMIVMAGVLLSCLMPLFPDLAWPFLPFGIALSTFGNSLLGIYSYACILIPSSFLSGTGIDIYICYFMAGTLAIVLFSHIDEGFKIGLPLFITHLFLFLFEIICSILYLNERLSYEMFILPSVNVCICLLFSFIILRLFCFRVVNRESIEYRDVADPEYDLMLWQKEVSPEDYYHALHTAHFAERIAAATGADTVLAKAGAFYQNAAKVYKEKIGDNSEPSEIIRRLCRDNGITGDMERVICEVTDKSCISRESTIVMFSDAVVTSVRYLMDKHPGQKIDYGKVADMIIQRKKDNGSLKNSLIAVNDLDVMRDIFVKEDLYYDFLRNEN